MSFGDYDTSRKVSDLAREELAKEKLKLEPLQVCAFFLFFFLFRLFVVCSFFLFFRLFVLFFRFRFVVFSL